MSAATGLHQANPASVTVRERCRALGLPTWRCDTGGAIIEEPVEPGLAGLWLRSGHIGGLISSTARSWIGVENPSVMNPAPGCWVLPVVDDPRRRRNGVVAAMAIGPDIIGSDLFQAACHSAGL